MTAVQLVNTCPVCGAEESMDAMLARMIEDDEARRLIAEVMTRSFVLGGHVARYLRLHKPPKHRLTMAKARTILAELVPAVVGGGFERKGRTWRLDRDGWDAAFAAVFRQAESGAMRLFERFTIGLPVFEGGDSRYPLVARLKYRNKDGKLVFWYELVRADKVFRAAVTEELDKIKAALPNCDILNGAPGVVA